MVEEGGMDAGVTDLARGKQRGIRHSRVESAIEDIRSRAENEDNVNYKRANFLPTVNANRCAWKQKGKCCENGERLMP